MNKYGCIGHCCWVNEERTLCSACYERMAR